jgi:hypothetical protein
VEVEETLVGAATTLGSGSHVRPSITGGTRSIAAPPWRRGERTRERRRLHVSPALDGMVRVDGDLDPETGQVVITTLRAVMIAARDASDRRSAPQRRADALGEICHQWMDGSDRPSIAGDGRT